MYFISTFRGEMANGKLIYPLAGGSYWNMRKHLFGGCTHQKNNKINTLSLFIKCFSFIFIQKFSLLCKKCNEFRVEKV